MALLQFVFISTLVFTGVILVLVAILAVIEANVVKKGDCKIFVNDDPKPLLVAAGKRYCHRRDPDCGRCPLGMLPHTREVL